ncbi:MAG: BolA family transcriptional regulator [Gammaproteobacteria bacterium]|nr:BolA family transcriptional regulator [Gammaproteobacteria bacterium]NVK88818.1 BolA family transcriptional regulator [Gammaproteobacteria bacterium]
MDNQQRMQDIHQRLQSLSPTTLEVIDDSHLHAGHAGAKSGKGHFTVVIASPAFSGKRPLQCHQMVYAALGEMMTTDIHALSIKIAD